MQPGAVSGRILFYGERTDFMSEFFSLRGRNALSDFRLNRLQQTLPAHLRSISAEYWHFVSVARTLSADERRILERILTYGPTSGSTAETGQMLLVVPRLGTISPW